MLYRAIASSRIDRGRPDGDRASGVVASYDKLVIATGSTPIVIPVPGANLPGVLTFRDLDDVDAMLLAAKSQRQGRRDRRRPARARSGHRPQGTRHGGHASCI